MAKPTEDPKWVTSEDPQHIVEPTTPQKLNGILSGGIWAREYLNWMFFAISKWIDWIRSNAMDKDNNLSELSDKATAFGAIKQSATTSATGVVALATGTEVATGTNSTKAITPSTLLSRTSTTARTGVVQLATGSDVITGTNSTKAITPSTLLSRTSTTARTGVVQLATGSDVITGTNSTKAITPSTLLSRTSTTARTGVVQLATGAEVQAGSDSTKAITPSTLHSNTATESRRGVVELATNTETQTGTDTDRAVTPANLSSRTATTTRTGLVEKATTAEMTAGTADKFPDAAIVKTFSSNASNLAAGTVPTARLPSATTSATGLVQLNNTLTSTSTTQALTAAQGKVLNDAVAARAPVTVWTGSDSGGVTAAEILSSSGHVVGLGNYVIKVSNLNFIVPITGPLNEVYWGSASGEEGRSYWGPAGFVMKIGTIYFNVTEILYYPL
mgnify:CR=1 FL=1